MPSLVGRGADLRRGGLGLWRKLGHRLNLRTNTKKAPAGQRRGVGDGLIFFFIFMSLGRKILKVGTELMKATLEIL